MYLRASSACILILNLNNVFAESTNIQHEVSIGFSDLRDIDDGFIGLNYRYYLDDVNIDNQAWAISPYLQRVDNVSINYFTLNDIYRAEFAGEIFLQNDWIVRGRYSRTEEDDRFYSQTRQRIGADLANFTSSHWEVGAGFDYYHRDEANKFNNPSIPNLSSSESEYSITGFARYTSFDRSAATFSPGWDIKLEATSFDNYYTLEAETDYYFTRKWSVGIDVIHAANDFSDSSTFLELGTNYWFNAHSSISFGAGIDTDNRGLGSITLLGTFRF